MRQTNPNTEFVLIATMIPNPECTYSINQEYYITVLNEIVSSDNGIVVADMTSTHKEMLKKKRYIDCTGNNFNHPNDFLIRTYAQVICSLLGLYN